MVLEGLELNISEEDLLKAESHIKKFCVTRTYYEKSIEDNQKKIEDLMDKISKLEESSRNTRKTEEKYNTLVKEYESLTESYKKEQENHENALKKVKIDYAVRDRLKNEGARNVDIIQKILDYSTINLDDNGALIGLEDQIKSLKSSEQTNFLFNIEKKNAPLFYTERESKGIPTSENSTPSNPFNDSLNTYYKSFKAPQSKI